MLDGLHTAIVHTPWRSADRQRVVILLSNAPGHLPGTERNPYALTVAGIASLARERGVQIIALHSNGGGGDDVFRTQRRMHEELAEQTGGLSLPFRLVHDLPHNLNEPSRLVGIDGTPRARASAEPATGWLAVPRSADEMRHEQSVLLARSQMSVLIRELTTLQAHLRLESDSREQSIFFRIPHGSTLAEVLRRMGLPVSDPRFEFTKRQLVQMSDQDRLALADYVDSVLLPGLHDAEAGTSLSPQDIWVPLRLLQ